MARARQAWRREAMRWEVARAWAGAAEHARRVRSSPLVSQILHNRGLDDPERANAFLNPRLADLHAPELLPDIDRAAERISQAVREGQPIRLYGDYDVDGMTGVAILYRCLKLHGAKVNYYIPHRLEEGYGVNLEAVEKLAAEGDRLLITVDCGVTADAPLRRAAELGMDVIVTDHHTPGPQLPPALAIVHPGLPGGGYPNPDLPGAGVAFKLAWAVSRRLCGSARVPEPMREFLLEATSLAALGVIADVVPLVGENRVLAVYGLKGLAATRHAGILALLESAKLVGEKLDAYHVGFCLAPRLNAAGRMGHANLAVELLARAEAARSREIATYLERQNAQRQSVERQMLDEALEMLQARPPGAHAVVLASPTWHAGVVGIVAARLVDRLHRPTVLIALNGEEGQGSARSIAGFHMRDALAACGQYLSSFGGHAMAGGLRLAARHVEDFAAAFAEHAARELPAESLQRRLRIDAEAGIADLTQPLVEHLERLAPFGQGNPRPIVALRNCRILTPPQRMGQSGATMSVLVSQEQPSPALSGATAAGAPAAPGSSPAIAGNSAAPSGWASAGLSRLRCVGFGMGDLVDELKGATRVDIAGEPVLNRFNGRVNVELHLRDVVIRE